MTEDASGLHEDPEANVGRSVLCLSGASWVQVLSKHLFVAHFLPLSSTSSVFVYTIRVDGTNNIQSQESNLNTGNNGALSSTTRPVQGNGPLLFLGVPTCASRLVHCSGPKSTVNIQRFRSIHCSGNARKIETDFCL